MNDTETVDELAAQFTGLLNEDGSWETTPVYSVKLAQAICRSTRPANEATLRKLLYGEAPDDNVPDAALFAIKIGFESWVRGGARRGL